MPDAVGLSQLVGAVAGAIVDAQALVEQRFIQQVSRYFDPEGNPLCLSIKMPRPGSSGDEMQIGLPLLSLAESSMLAIKDLRIDLDVELGSIIDTDPGTASGTPTAGGGAPGAALDLAMPDPAQGFRSAGAPIDIPVVSMPTVPAAAGDTGAPVQPAPAAPVPGLPEKMLTLSVGSTTSTGPKARLSINVAAKPPSEAMLRLMTQLNKLV